MDTPVPPSTIRGDQLRMALSFLLRLYTNPPADPSEVLSAFPQLDIQKQSPSGSLDWFILSAICAPYRYYLDRLSSQEQHGPNWRFIIPSAAESIIGAGAWGAWLSSRFRRRAPISSWSRRILSDQSRQNLTDALTRFLEDIASGKIPESALVN